MARPLKKGPPIQFRLPVELHAVLVERAAVHDETPAEYVERNILAALMPPVPTVQRQVTPRPKAAKRG